MTLTIKELTEDNLDNLANAEDNACRVEEAMQAIDFHSCSKTTKDELVCDLRRILQT